METVKTVEFLVKIRCIPRILLQESLLGNSGAIPKYPNSGNRFNGFLSIRRDSDWLNRTHIKIPYNQQTRQGIAV